MAEHQYEMMESFEIYAPWRSDHAFTQVFQTIRSHTLVGGYRCYELWSLIEQSQKLHGALLEVGVWRGGTAAIIAGRAKSLGIQDPVYLCDTFAGVVKAGSRDSSYKGGEHSAPRAIAERLLRSFQLDNVRILEGMFPEETGHLIKETAFRFCHIDVDVYQSAKDIMDWVWDKMVVGGIVVYDDYGCKNCDGITRYVDEQRPLGDRMVVYNLNAHAVVIKIK